MEPAWDELYDHQGQGVSVIVFGSRYLRLTMFAHRDISLQAWATAVHVVFYLLAENENARTRKKIIWQVTYLKVLQCMD